MQVAVGVLLFNFNLDFFPHKNDILNDGEGDTHLHTLTQMQYTQAVSALRGCQGDQVTDIITCS